MNDASFEGLLTDYALGEMDDPDTKALLEALLERDESLRASLAEIRSTTELIVLAGAESLVGESRSKRPRFFLRPSRLAAVAAAVAAALVVVSSILWWQGSTNTNSAPDLAEIENENPAANSPQTLTAGDTAAAGGHPLPWMAIAVEKRPTRPSRRGAGNRWASLIASQAANRQ